MNELLRNGSGYYDPTAYNAMTNIIKSEKVKKVNKMKQGEIWEIKQNNGTYKNVIVLAVHDDVAQVLQINDAANGYSITVNCQGIKYTDPRKIQYTFNDTFVSFIRSLKAEEFDKIMDAVAEGLGLSTQRTLEAVKPIPPVFKAGDFIPLPEHSADLFDIEAIKDAERAKAERDVYKGLYEKLLADVMQK